MKAVTCYLTVSVHLLGMLASLPTRSDLLDLISFRQTSGQWLSRQALTEHDVIEQQNCEAHFHPYSNDLIERISSLGEGGRIYLQPGIYRLRQTIIFNNLKVYVWSEMPVYEADWPEYTAIRSSILFKSQMFAQGYKESLEVLFNLHNGFHEDSVYFIRHEDIDPRQNIQVVFQGQNVFNNVNFISLNDTAMGPYIISNGTFVKQLGNANLYVVVLPLYQPGNNDGSNGQAAGSSSASEASGTKGQHFHFGSLRKNKKGASASGGGGDRPPDKPLSFGKFIDTKQPELNVLVIILRHLLGYIFKYAEGDVEDFRQRLIQVVEYLQSAVSVDDMPGFHQQGIDVCTRYLPPLGMPPQRDVTTTLQLLSSVLLNNLMTNHIEQLRNLVVTLLSEMLSRPSCAGNRIRISVSTLRTNAPAHGFSMIEEALKKEHDGNQKEKTFLAAAQQQQRHTQDIRLSPSVLSNTPSLSESVSNISEDYKLLLALLRKLAPKDEASEQWSDETNGLFALLAQGFSSTSGLVLFATALGLSESCLSLQADDIEVSPVEAYRMLVQLYISHLEKGGTRKIFVKVIQEVLGIQFFSIVARIKSELDNLGNCVPVQKEADESIETLLLEYISAHPVWGATPIPISHLVIDSMAEILTENDLERLAAELRYHIYVEISINNMYDLLKKIMKLYFNTGQTLESFIFVLVHVLGDKAEAFYHQLPDPNNVKRKAPQ